MPEIPLIQSGFTCSAYESLTKNKERIQKFKETGDFWYIHQKEPNKACFQNGIAYRDFKNLTRRTVSDKILRSKGFNHNLGGRR